MAKGREGLPLGEGLRLRLWYLPLTHWEALAEMTVLWGLLQGPSWCSEGWAAGGNPHRSMGQAFPLTGGKGGSEAKSSAGPEAPGRPAAALLGSLLSFAPDPRL